MSLPPLIGFASRYSGFLRAVSLLTVTGSLVIASPSIIQSDFHGAPRASRPEIERAITVYATRYRLDPAFLRAVIKVESDFRPHVISNRGAVGLMQLTPGAAAGLQVGDIHDPIQNIRGGAHQLRRLLTRYNGDVRLTLAAYNAGTNRVRGRQIPRIRETRRYVTKVLHYYDTFRAADRDPFLPVQQSRAADAFTASSS